MIRSVTIIDLFDDRAIAHLREQAKAGQPVAVLLPMSSSSPRHDMDLMLDALHQGASRVKPLVLGTIAASTSGLGRVNYDSEYKPSVLYNASDFTR